MKVLPHFWRLKIRVHTSSQPGKDDFGGMVETERAEMRRG